MIRSRALPSFVLGDELLLMLRRGAKHGVPVFTGADLVFPLSIVTGTWGVPDCQRLCLSTA